MSDIQVNYPSTLFHFNDTSNNYSEVSALTVKIQNGDAFQNAFIDSTQFKVEVLNASQSSRLTVDGFNSTNSTTEINLNADSGLSIDQGDGINYITLTQHQIEHSGDVPLDMTFNSLTLGGVSSTEGQVVMADASGAPYWETLPTQTLATVMGAGADASFNTITSIGGLELQVSQDPLVDPVVISSDISGSLVISSATPSNLVDTTYAAKQFSGSYMKVILNGVESYLQIYTAVNT
jgi:hypothetical protein